jgi:hypothetical protein
MSTSGAESTQSVSKARAGRDLNITQIQYGGDLVVPLLPPFKKATDGTPSTHTSLLGSLRASESEVKLVGRDAAIARASAWRREASSPGDGSDHSVLVIHGPGGAGKTRLAAEILQQASDDGWVAGFLSSSPPPNTAWAHLAHPSRKPMMIAIDYAEARYSDLQRLFEYAPIAHPGGAPLRLILIVREGKAPSETWAGRLAGGRDLGGRAARLLDPARLEVLSLDRSLPELSDRSALWGDSHATYTTEAREPPDYLVNDLFDRPLFVLLDAYREFASSSRNEEAPPTAEELIREILKHERTYWSKASADLGLKLNERDMNQVATVATLVGGVTRPAFEEALGALDRFRGDPDLLRGATDWWCAVYAMDSGAIRGVEPDIVGEYMVMRALDDGGGPRDRLRGSMRPEQLTSLIEAATPVGRQRVLRVLTRIANAGSDASRHAARRLLTEILESHLDDFVPGAFRVPQSTPDHLAVGEPLVTTVASAVLASGQLELMEPRSGERETASSSKVDAAATAKNAALRIIRQQIDRVAAREFGAERWDVERFAALIIWSLRLDLEAGETDEARRKLTLASSLKPRPRRYIAVLLVEMARDLLSRKQTEAAEDLLQQAMNEIAEAGDADSIVAYVVLHDLGNAAAAAADRPLALERYGAALEGKRRLNGLADMDTLATLLRLTQEMARDDVDAALAQIEVAAAELSESGAPEKEIAELRQSSAMALRTAAVTAVGRKDMARAVDLLRRGREELAALGAEDSLVACVLSRDLGDLAVIEGELETAIEYYEAAHEREEKMLGSGHESTVTTLLKIISAEVGIDPDRGLRHIALAYDELETGDAKQLYRVVAVWQDLLGHRGNFDEAEAVGRMFQERRLATEVRRAIFDSTTAATLSERYPVSTALDGGLLAAEIFPPSDPRFLPLASRLAVLTLQLIGELVHSQFDSSMRGAPFRELLVNEARAFAAHEEHEHQEGEAAVEIRRRLDEIPGFTHGIVEAIPTRIQEELRKAAQDPLVELLKSEEQSTMGGLLEQPSVRRWLVHTASDAPPPTDVERQMAFLFSFYVSVLTDRQLRPPVMSGAPEVWKGEPGDDVLESAGEMLTADVEAFMEVDTEAARGLVSAAKVRALISAATESMSGEELEVAEKFLGKAADELERNGNEDSVVACEVAGYLAFCAARAGSHGVAIARFYGALDEWRRVAGITHVSTLSTLRALVLELAPIDFDRAMALLDEASEELSAAGADEDMRAGIQEGRMEVCMTAGRAAFDTGKFEGAGRCFEQAEQAIESLGADDPLQRYVILHDLASVASALGDSALACQQYERSLEGKQRLKGAADPDAVTTILSLLREIAGHDREQALQRATATMDELADSPDQAKRIEAWVTLNSAPGSPTQHPK